MTITTNAKAFVTEALATKKAQAAEPTKAPKTPKAAAIEIMAASKAVKIAALVEKNKAPATKPAKVQLNDPHGLTEEAKARAQAKAKGPKPGSARSNQSAVYAHKEELVPQPTTKPKTKKVLGAGDFAHPTDKQMRAEIEADLRKIANETGAPRLAQLGQKQPTQLARGISSREAPQSAAAMAESRTRKTTPKPATKTPTPNKAQSPTASNKSIKGITLLPTQTITIATPNGANPYRPGTKAHASFELFRTSKTVAATRAAATKDHDINYLRYASRDGHIKLG